MLSKLYWAAAIWTTLGLVGGLGYREVTKHYDFDGTTQLAVVHTHLLVLGTIVLLAALVLEKVFTLSRSRWSGWFFWSWNAGIAITATTMVVIGLLQITHPESADSVALAGVAGLGHMTLTAGFIALFVALKARLNTAQEA